MKEKAASGSLSLYPEQWRYLESLPEAKSKRVRDLVARDMEGGEHPLPGFSHQNCLVELTRTFCPARVPQMVEFCENGGKPLNQPIALENILKLIATGNIGISQEFLLAAESAPVYNQRKKPTEK